MAKKEIKELKKLSPAERIEKLKKIQEKDKKEIEEAQKLIDESEEEEAREQEELERIPIPQIKSVNIDDLFTQEEKELFRQNRFVVEKEKTEKEKKPEKKEKELEDITFQSTEEIRKAASANADYLEEMSMKPAAELKGRIGEIYSDVKDTGYMTSGQQEELQQIHYATQKKLKDIEEGRYSGATKDAAREMVVTEQMKNLLQSRYDSGTTYKRTD